MKKSFIVFGLLLLFVCNDICAASYSVGSNVTDLCMEQDFENEPYLFFKQNNQIKVILPDENIKNLYESSGSLEKISTYSNFYRFVIILTEKENEITSNKILIVNKDGLVEADWAFNNQEDIADKLKISFSNNYLNLFWNTQNVLYRLAYSYETKDFCEEEIATNVIDFKINERRYNFGFFLSNNNLYEFNFAEPITTTEFISSEIKEIYGIIFSGYSSEYKRVLVKKNRELCFLSIFDGEENVSTVNLYNLDNNNIEINENYIFLEYELNNFITAFSDEENGYIGILNTSECMINNIPAFVDLKIVPISENSVELCIKDKENCFRNYIYNFIDNTLSVIDAFDFQLALKGYCIESNNIYYIFENEFNQTLKITFEENIPKIISSYTHEDLFFNKEDYYIYFHEVLIFNNKEIYLGDLSTGTTEKIEADFVSVSQVLNNILYISSIDNQILKMEKINF